MRTSSRILSLLVLALSASSLKAFAETEEPVEGGEIPGRQAHRRGVRTRPVAGRRLGNGQNWSARGNGCSNDNVQIIENGETFSIILSDFTLNLPQGDRSHGADHTSACTINLMLTPPEGMMFAGLYQVISGGVIKSEKSRVALRVNYSIGPRGYRAQPLIWERGAVDASSLDSIFSLQLENPTLPRIVRCREQVKYRMRMVLNGTRANARDEFIMAGIDSLDGQFITNVRPVFVPCR
jgi:hypothetical protein